MSSPRDVAALASLLAHLAALRALLPTRAPTAAESAQDPQRLDYVLSCAQEELALVETAAQVLAHGQAEPPASGAFAAERPFYAEVLARGWLALLTMPQPDPFIDDRVRPLRRFSGAVRLSDGLALWTRTGAELLSRIDAVNAAAKAGTSPWWVPEGLTLEPERKCIRWPEAPAEPAPAVVTASTTAEPYCGPVKHACSCGFETASADLALQHENETGHTMAAVAGEVRHE